MINVLLIESTLRDFFYFLTEKNQKSTGIKKDISIQSFISLIQVPEVFTWG